jgi:hypothetical protein
MGQLYIDGICMDGFTEPVAIEELRRNRYAAIPKSPGVYVVMRVAEGRPVFLATSTGGWFKGLDPSYSLEVASANWVEGARVVYVGMSRARKGPRGRLCQFFDFGAGKAIGHRGGRLLWHLKDSNSLEVRWRACSAGEADRSETAAITCFKAVHGGKRPYANWNK